MRHCRQFYFLQDYLIVSLLTYTTNVPIRSPRIFRIRLNRSIQIDKHAGSVGWARIYNRKILDSQIPIEFRNCIVFISARFLVVRNLRKTVGARLEIFTKDVSAPATSKTPRIIEHSISFWQANEIHVVHEVHRFRQDQNGEIIK